MVRLVHSGWERRPDGASARDGYLAAMQALWSQEEASYQGEFVSFAASWAWPKPVQQPRVPVLAGATSGHEEPGLGASPTLGLAGG